MTTTAIHTVKSTMHTGHKAAQGGKHAAGASDAFSQLLDQILNPDADGKVAGPGGLIGATLKDSPLTKYAAGLTDAQTDKLQEKMETILGQLSPELRQMLQQLAAQQPTPGALNSALNKLAAKSPELQQALQSAAKQLCAVNGTPKSNAPQTPAGLAIGTGLMTYALHKQAAAAAAKAPVAGAEADVQGAEASDAAAEHAATAQLEWNSEELKVALARALSAAAKPAASAQQAATEAGADAATHSNVLAEFIPARLLKNLSKAAASETKGEATAGDHAPVRGKIEPLLKAFAPLANESTQGPAATLKSILQAAEQKSAAEHGDAGSDNNDFNMATVGGFNTSTIALPQGFDVAPVHGVRAGADQKIIDQINTITSQLLGRVDSHVSATGDTQSTSLRLHPADLGDVRVELTIGQDRSVQAQIIAQRPETAALLQRNVQQLNDSLARQGFSVERLQVSTQPALAAAGSAQSDANYQQQEGRAPWQMFREQTPGRKPHHEERQSFEFQQEQA